MTTISVANRIQNLPNYPFVKISADVRALQAAGQNILRLDMGSPDLPPPAPVIEHLAQSARQPSKHGYAGYRGIPAFRAAVARYYKRMFGVVLDPESEVLPLLGSKEGIMNLTLALVNPGDTVLAPRPGYPAYEMTATFAGATIAGMRLSPEHNYLPDINQIPLEVAQAAKLMWVNYPNNPTGALASAEDYNRL
ncbi:MAG: aminotransferase class I/II-fold pyridoxal phosphate-dependent enzyme, partial [Anaerolineales bacterium]